MSLVCELGKGIILEVHEELMLERHGCARACGALSALLSLFVDM